MAVVIGRGSLGGLGFDSQTSDDKAEDDIREDEQIVRNIQRIDYNINQLGRLVDTIGTTEDSKKLRNNVHTLLQTTSLLTKETGQVLKNYSKERPEYEDDIGEWKLKQTRFKEDFQKVVVNQQQLQAEARKKERFSLRQTLIQSGYHDLEISESGEITKDGKQCDLEALQKEEEETIKLIKEREAALKQLEQDIVDINCIFKDLHDMVQEQGEDITTAETNIIKAEEDVKAAVDDLAVALDNVNAARKKKLASIVIVILFLAVILTIILAATL